MQTTTTPPAELDTAGGGPADAGGVLFGDVNGLPTTNVSAFSWDNANTRLTVGNAWFYTVGSAGTIFIGQNAGNLTYSGVGQLTGLGHTALQGVTTGSGLTAVGDAAMKAATTAVQSTAIGDSALLAMTTGHHNVAVGTQAFRSVVDATQGTAIGVDALEWVVSTGGSVALGYQAGMDAGGTLTSLTNCLFLGTNATASANGLTNAMAIGFAAQVGANNTCVIGNGSIAAVLPGVANATLGNATVPWKLIAANGTAAAPGMNFAQNAGDGFYGYTGGVVAFTIAGTGQALLTTNELRVASGLAINWGSSTFDSTGDTGLSRAAAHVLALTSAGGSSACTYRVYGSSTLYATFGHDGTVGRISTDGTTVGLQVGIAGGVQWQLDNAANWGPVGSDAVRSLGQPSTRVNNGYFGGTMNLSLSGVAMVFTNATTTTGVNTGTLTNCPHNGNPALYLEISVNGTTYAVPCFALT